MMKIGQNLTLLVILYFFSNKTWVSFFPNNPKFVNINFSYNSNLQMFFSIKANILYRFYVFSQWMDIDFVFFSSMEGMGQRLKIL